MHISIIPHFTFIILNIAVQNVIEGVADSPTDPPPVLEFFAVLLFETKHNKLNKLNNNKLHARRLDLPIGTSFPALHL